MPSKSILAIKSCFSNELGDGVHEKIVLNWPQKHYVNTGKTAKFFAFTGNANWI